MKESDCNTRQYEVLPKYRTNPLHRRGDGATIIIHYKTGLPSKIYTNIQYPDAYIKKIKEGREYIIGEIDSIVVEGADQEKGQENAQGNDKRKGAGTSPHHTDNTDLPF